MVPPILVWREPLPGITRNSLMASSSILDPKRLPSLQELNQTYLKVEKELEFLSSSHNQLADAKSKCFDNVTMIDHLGRLPIGIRFCARQPDFR